MNIIKMNNPRPGQFVQCVKCSAMVEADKAFLDLDGIPYKAYYHEGCIPLEYHSIVKRRIVKWYPGKFGYKTFYQLQRWNTVFMHWYSEHDAIALEFIESHCLIKGIDFKSIPVIEISEDK